MHARRRTGLSVPVDLILHLLNQPDTSRLEAAESTGLSSTSVDRGLRLLVEVGLTSMKNAKGQRGYRYAWVGKPTAGD